MEIQLPNMNVDDAMRHRRAIRAYLRKPVPAGTVREILDIARLTPSGGNLQPWKVHALAGEPLRRLIARIDLRLAAGDLGGESEYEVYPRDLWEPHRARRRDSGKLRYAALGASGKSEIHRLELTRRNYRFFGAPVGLFFCLDRRMGAPQWADMGMYMQSVMLLAAARGLDTCPQEVWSNWARTIADHIGLPQSEMVFAGMALGYRDESEALCCIAQERAELEDFATLSGFDDM